MLQLLHVYQATPALLLFAGILHDAQIAGATNPRRSAPNKLYLYNNNIGASRVLNVQMLLVQRLLEQNALHVGQSEIVAGKY